MSKNVFKRVIGTRKHTGGLLLSFYFESTGIRQVMDDESSWMYFVCWEIPRAETADLA